MATEQPPLTRTLLRELAEARLAEAQLLLRSGQFSGAYYLAGYAAELGLKACIARQFRADQIPDRRLVERTYSHNLDQLVNLAGLAEDLKQRRALSDAFATYWTSVTNWSEQARYRVIGREDAEGLITALNDPADGVLRWIRANW
jgi:HEPN domain-containing protein